MSDIKIDSQDYSLKAQLPKNIGPFDYRQYLYSELMGIIIEESLNFIRKFPVQEDIKDKYFSRHE